MDRPVHCKLTTGCQHVQPMRRYACTAYGWKLFLMLTVCAPAHKYAAQGPTTTMRPSGAHAAAATVVWQYWSVQLQLEPRRRYVTFYFHTWLYHAFNDHCSNCACLQDHGADMSTAQCRVLGQSDISVTDCWALHDPAAWPEGLLNALDYDSLNGCGTVRVYTYWL